MVLTSFLKRILHYVGALSKEFSVSGILGRLFDGSWSEVPTLDHHPSTAAHRESSSRLFTTADVAVLTVALRLVNARTEVLKEMNQRTSNVRGSFLNVNAVSRRSPRPLQNRGKHGIFRWGWSTMIAHRPFTTAPTTAVNMKSPTLSTTQPSSTQKRRTHPSTHSERLRRNEKPPAHTTVCRSSLETFGRSRQWAEKFLKNFSFLPCVRSRRSIRSSDFHDRSGARMLLTDRWKTTAAQNGTG